MTATRDRCPASQGTVNRPRLFLDCSMTSQSTQRTGVQRVVRNVVACAPAIARSVGMESRTVVFRDGRWRDDPQALHLARKVQEGRCAAGTASGPRRCIRSWVQTCGQRLSRSLYPRTLARLLRRLAIHFSDCGEAGPDFRPGDVLLLLDGSWTLPEIPSCAAARRAGARVGLVVYDLLPLTHPQFMVPKARRRFARWMRRVVPQADFFVAISRTVRDTFRVWVRKEFPERRISPQRVSWFPMGVKLDLAAHEKSVRPELAAVFGDAEKTYVKVGTLEPRKNHPLVLDAFDIVWQEFPGARLCFLGRRGWMCDDLVRRIERHPRRGKQLYWFGDADDGELDYCLRRAHAAVFASLAEGYGLPVAEALQYGLPAFVSDIPIHREVGGAFCSWFDPQRPESLARLIIAHLRTGTVPCVRAPAEFAPATWDEATRVLVEECRRWASLGETGELSWVA